MHPNLPLPELYKADKNGLHPTLADCRLRVRGGGICPLEQEKDFRLPPTFTSLGCAMRRPDVMDFVWTQLPENFSFRGVMTHKADLVRWLRTGLDHEDKLIAEINTSFTLSRKHLRTVQLHLDAWRRGPSGISPSSQPDITRRLMLPLDTVADLHLKPLALVPYHLLLFSHRYCQWPRSGRSSRNWLQ